MKTLLVFAITLFFSIHCWGQTAEDYYNNGKQKIDSNDLKGALEEFNKAIGLNPNYWEAIGLRASVKYDLDDLKGALTDFNKVIELEPSFPNYYLYRGDTKLDLGDLTGALEDYNNSIRLDPNNSNVYNNRGFAKYKLALVSAENRAKQEEQKYNDELFYRLGEALKRGFNGDPNAKQDYERIQSEADKKKREPLNIEISIADYKDAVQDYNKAIELKPNYSFAYKNRGDLKIEIGDKFGAINDYSSAVELNPKYSNAYFKRGIAKYNLGDKNGGCQDWSKAGELGLTKAYEYIQRHCK